MRNFASIVGAARLGFCFRWGIYAALFFIAVWSWSELFLSSANSFIRRPEWVVGKAATKLELIGGYPFLMLPSALAKNQVDLGKWYGQQEISTAAEFEATRLSLKLKLDLGGVFALFLGNPEEGHIGLVLKTPGHGGSQFIQSQKIHGPFTRNEKIQIEVPPGKWNELIFERAADSWQVEVAGERSVVPYSHPIKGAVTLRALAGAAVVDDFEVWEGARQSWRDSFENRESAWGLVGLVALGLLFCFLTIAAITLLVGRPSPSLAIPFALRFLAVLGVLLFGFDWYLFSEAELDYSDMEYYLASAETTPRGLVKTGILFFGKIKQDSALALVQVGRQVEGLSPVAPRDYRKMKKGKVILCGWGPTGECDRANEIPHITGPRSRQFRVAVLGPSFIMGSGAATLNESFSFYIQDELSKLVRPKKVLLVNFALQGSPFHDQIRALSDHKNFDPDIVLFDEHGLGSVSEMNAFAKDFLGNSFGSMKRKVFLLRNDESIAAADSFDPSVISLELGQFLNSEDLHRNGIVWWDSRHATSYSQKAGGRWISHEIYRILKEPSEL